VHVVERVARPVVGDADEVEQRRARLRLEFPPERQRLGEHAHVRRVSVRDVEVA
jgi:hypothetical protein